MPVLHFFPRRTPMAKPTKSAKFNKSQDGSSQGPSLQSVPPVQPGTTDARRALPSSDDAEKGVLSCMIQDPDVALGAAQERLKAEQFHQHKHRVLFELLIDLRDKGKPIDPVSLQQTLADRNLMAEIGGPGTVGELLNFVPTPAHIHYYMEIVLNKHVLRCMIDVCTNCTVRAFDEQEDVAGLLDDAEKNILAIRDAVEGGREMADMKKRVAKAFESIETMIENPNALNGLPTGYRDLDDMTNGLHGSEMFIIAARPSMGKTSFVMNIVEHVAVDHKKPVAVFSLEMSGDQLVQRLICSRARINMRELRTGFLKNNDFPRLTQACSDLRDAPIYIDDTPSLSIGEFKAKARRLWKAYKIEMIAIDYLQLMRSTSKRAGENRQIEIAEISSGLKAVAKELDIPILVLAQLNRNVEGRSGNKPRISDLRESGSIEQDADVVALLHRPEYYADGAEAREEAQGEVELIIAKQRNGPTGEVPLTFIKEFMRFENRAPEHAVPG